VDMLSLSAAHERLAAYSACVRDRTPPTSTPCTAPRRFAAAGRATNRKDASDTKTWCLTVFFENRLAVTGIRFACD
ncbi:MAG TPA: hypothetical protein PK867_29265, partial [Pirellulales bacterium]|nr:hypothetical protein [Pirellulales bacterium]